MENCWYINSCNKFKENQCDSSCIRYAEMSYLMNNSNIPKAKQLKNELTPEVIDLENFKYLTEIKNDILNFVKNGESLYIFSQNFGNGKTTWAIKLMQKYFDKVWAGNGFKQRGLFIHVPSFLTKFKEVMNKKDEEFEDLKNQLVEVDLVI